MKLRTSQLFLIALVGAGFGAWYGVDTARRGGAALTLMIRAAKNRSARAYFCHAPPEVALPQVRAWAQRQSEAPEDNAVLAKYPRVALAMLNERLGRAEAANADWAGVLRGCEGESCKRERWREQVQKVCKP